MSDVLILKPPFNRAWDGLDAFDEAMKLEGKVFRAVAARKTLRFEFEGRPYFAKIHHGIGWAEIIKNLVQLRLPIMSASNEWKAVNRLHELEIDTMTAVGYGQWGINPASIRSFIITEELTDTLSLEDVCKDWISSPPKLNFKWALLQKLALISQKLHGAGICHRDYYLCHFHLDMKPQAALKLSMIDLHRALIKKNLSSRWVIKDVAGLYFSAMDIGLSQRDLYRFMKLYSGQSLRYCLTQQLAFWQKVEERALKLYRKT